MRPLIKYSILILFLSGVVSAGVSTSVYAQESDYQIVNEFRNSYLEITQQIEDVGESTELEEVSEAIDEFENRFSDQETLINSSIYPETYESRIAALRERFRIRELSVNTIEELNVRVDDLTEEITSYTNQLDELDLVNENLLSEIEASQASEEQMSALVSDYRASLEARDQFVSDMLEDLLTRYESMDPSSEEELAETATRLDDTPVELIETILGEYINQTEQNAGLETPDYLRMKAQHAYFRQVWDRIGERLTELFVPERPVQAEQEVSDRLAAWNAGIENRLWNSLSESFNNNGISLTGFSGQNEFHESLVAYIDEATSTSREVNTDDDYSRFQNFFNFWNNTVKSEWGEYLTNGDLLTYSQMASIDSELEEWNEAALPTSNLMLILLLISVAVIVGLVVLLVRKK